MYSLRSLRPFAILCATALNMASTTGRLLQMNLFQRFWGFEMLGREAVTQGAQGTCLCRQAGRKGRKEVTQYPFTLGVRFLIAQHVKVIDFIPEISSNYFHFKRC